MVDGITSAYGASYGYGAQSPHQTASQSSGGRQTTTITVETSEESTVARIKQGGKEETVTSSSYSESVTISVATDSSGSGSAGAGTPSGALATQTQNGQLALATVEQTAAEARDFLKNDAKQKLQIALNELKLLKLLGNTPAGAKEAAQLAKQIADASSEYAAGGGASAADDATTGDADGTPDTGTVAGASTTGATAGSAGQGAAASSAATASAAGATTAATSTAASTSGTSQSAASAASPTGAASEAGGTGALTPAQQDPFYQEVQAALQALKKYLQKTLPALEVSPDAKTRKLAKDVQKSFNESVAQIADAEAEFNAESIGSDAGDEAALGGSDGAASAAAAVVAAVYQPVNISA
ncbi:MAG: hypothetical protein WDN69_20130 [Aliidongia sp.]